MDATEHGDRTEIRRLADEYAHAADTGDGARFAAAFTDDGVLIASATSRYDGTAELATVPAKLARYRRTQHLVGEQTIDLDGDTATAVTGCEAHHVHLDDDGVERDRVLHLHYRDRYVRTPDGWRIAERRLDIDRTTDDPTGA